MVSNVASISDALFTRTQQRVLGLLFAHPDKSFYTNEIVRRVKTGIGAVQRELQRLESAGLVTSKKIGNQKHYQANPVSPVFHELKAIVMKTVGLADILREALMPLHEQVDVAFIFGSIAHGRERVSSDVDVMVIGHVSFEQLVMALYSSQELLGREINPVAMSSHEFSGKALQGDRFVSRIVEEPKIFLKGDNNDLAELAANRSDQETSG